MKQAVLIRLRVKVIYTPEADDISYLDIYENATTEEERGYHKRNQARKAEYGNTWCHVGVRATAAVMIPYDSNGQTQYKMEIIKSGGLWGIESDSSDSYFAEVGAEQIEELKGYLETLNVNTEGGIEILGERVEAFWTLKEQALDNIEKD